MWFEGAHRLGSALRSAGASPQSLHRIIAGDCAPQRNSAVYPQLAEIAGRLFEGGPVPCLLWCQREPCLQRR